MSTGTLAAAGAKPRLRPQDRRALTYGVAALVVLLGYSRIVRPVFTQLQADRGAVENERSLLDREQALLAAAPTFPRVARDARQALVAEAPRLFPGDSVAATAGLTAYVAEMTGRAGVHLASADARAPRTMRGLTRVSVDIRAEGSWTQVLGFIHSLESSSRLIDATNIRIERGGRNAPGSGAVVSLSATLAGYARSSQ